MPYIPRRLSPTVGVPPENQKTPVQVHPPLPAADKKTDTPEGRRKSLGVPKMSLHDHETDTKQVLKTMFGKEPDVDPYTGQLVLASHAAPRQTGNG